MLQYIQIIIKSIPMQAYIVKSNITVHANHSYHNIVKYVPAAITNPCLTNYNHD